MINCEVLTKCCEEIQDLWCFMLRTEFHCLLKDNKPSRGTRSMLAELQEGKLIFFYEFSDIRLILG